MSFHHIDQRLCLVQLGRVLTQQSLVADEARLRRDYRPAADGLQSVFAHRRAALRHIRDYIRKAHRHRRLQCPARMHQREQVNAVSQQKPLHQARVFRNDSQVPALLPKLHRHIREVRQRHHIHPRVRHSQHQTAPAKVQVVYHHARIAALTPHLKVSVKPHNAQVRAALFDLRRNVRPALKHHRNARQRRNIGNIAARIAARHANPARAQKSLRRLEQRAIARYGKPQTAVKRHFLKTFLLSLHPGWGKSLSLYRQGVGAC